MLSILNYFRSKKDLYAENAKLKEELKMLYLKLDNEESKYDKLRLEKLSEISRLTKMVAENKEVYEEQLGKRDEIIRELSTLNLINQGITKEKAMELYKDISKEENK